MGLIQTAEQLTFSYQAIIEGAKRLTESTDKEVTYKREVDLQNSQFHYSVLEKILDPSLPIFKFPPQFNFSKLFPYPS